MFFLESFKKSKAANFAAFDWRLIEGWMFDEFWWSTTSPITTTNHSDQGQRSCCWEGGLPHMLLGVPLVEMLGVVNKIGCLRCTKWGEKDVNWKTLSHFFWLLQPTNEFFFFLSGKRMWTGPLFFGERIISLKDIIQFSTFFFGCVSGDWHMAPWHLPRLRSTQWFAQPGRGMRQRCWVMLATPHQKNTKLPAQQTGWRIQVKRCFKSMWW